jgi:hypothetical protein
MNWPVGQAVQVVRPGMLSGKLDVTNDVHGSVMLHTSGPASPSPPQPASMSTAAQARIPVAARATRPQLETAFGIAPSLAVRLALRKVTACKALPLAKKSYCHMEQRGAS